MQGGAQQDHGPLLTGLTPDTGYRYPLQGSDATGTIYRSNTLTFRTRPAIDSGFGANIATAGTVTGVSSEFSGAFAAANTIDGDLATERSTARDGGRVIRFDADQTTGGNTGATEIEVFAAP